MSNGSFILPGPLQGLPPFSQRTLTALNGASIIQKIFHGLFAFLFSRIDKKDNLYFIMLMEAFRPFPSL